MKQVIYTSEVLGKVETEHGACEVCATAGAHYEEGLGQLSVDLDAFLRSTNLRAKEKQFRADWLPKAETVREAVGADEAVELTRDVFHQWVRKVREAAPALSHA